MNAPLWSILIPTLANRTDLLGELLAVLLPQAEADGRVEIVALFNHGDRPVGVLRQELLEAARGEYISFVDDDDMVEPDYVPAITAAMGTRPDFIAFEHAYYVDGVRQPCRIVTGIGYDGWHDGYANDGWLLLVRDVTHINPVRRDVALRARFPGQRSGEDYAYIAQLRPLLRSQVSIGRVMYHYRHRPRDSAQHALGDAPAQPRPGIGSPCFRWI
jgi:glycosyltransferase involved in cell wall biosynthesis